jgi:hypothetical protein
MPRLQLLERMLREAVGSPSPPDRGAFAPKHDDWGCSDEATPPDSRRLKGRVREAGWAVRFYLWWRRL